MPHTALLLGMTDTVPLDIPYNPQSLGLMRMSRLDSHTLYATQWYCTAGLVGTRYIAWRQERSYSISEGIPNMYLLMSHLQRCCTYPWDTAHIRLVRAKTHIYLLHMTCTHLRFRISRQHKADKVNSSLCRSQACMICIALCSYMTCCL